MAEPAVDTVWNFGDGVRGPDAPLAKVLQFLGTGIVDDSGNRIVAVEKTLTTRMRLIGDTVDVTIHPPYPRVYPGLGGGLVGFNIQAITIRGDVAEVTVAGLPYRPKIRL